MKYQFFKKTSINLLVFQYVNYLLVMFICYQINISSIRNKFEPLVTFINNNLDILMISETKIDGTLPDSQFLIKDFSVPKRRDRTAKGRGVLLFIKENIPSKRIKKSHIRRVI